jgi:hypothetical protein
MSLSHFAEYDIGCHQGCSSFAMLVSSVWNFGNDLASSLSDIKFVNWLTSFKMMTNFEKKGRKQRRTKINMLGCQVMQWAWDLVRPTVFVHLIHHLWIGCVLCGTLWCVQYSSVKTPYGCCMLAAVWSEEWVRPSQYSNVQISKCWSTYMLCGTCVNHSVSLRTSLQYSTWINTLYDVLHHILGNWSN